MFFRSEHFLAKKQRCGAVEPLLCRIYVLPDTYVKHETGLAHSFVGAPAVCIIAVCQMWSSSESSPSSTPLLRAISPLRERRKGRQEWREATECRRVVCAHPRLCAVRRLAFSARPAGPLWTFLPLLRTCCSEDTTLVKSWSDSEGKDQRGKPFSIRGHKPQRTK